LSITYRKNPLYSEGDLEQPRLFATLDLSRYGVPAKVTDLPIYFRRLEKPIGAIREVYSTHIAGLPVEKGNLQSLVAVLDTYLAALVRFERLPEFMFRVGHTAWPIYRLPTQLVTRYPGGPVFSAPTIAELRIWLADHFKQLGRIRNRKELGILYFSQFDLQLYPPDCTLRSPQTADIPVFPTKNGQGQQLLAPVDIQSITVPMNEGAEIFDLHQEVGTYLVKRGQLADPYDMTVRKLATHTWARIQAALEPYAQALTYYRELGGRLQRLTVPVFTNGRTLVAARINRLGRISLLLAPDIRGLRWRVGEELYRQGAIGDPDAVRIVPARPDERCSALDRLLHAPVFANHESVGEEYTIRNTQY